MRALLRSAALVALVGLLVLATLPPARAGTEPPSSVATAYNTQRKLVRSEDGTLYAAIAVNVSGQPEIRVLSTRDGASWTTLPHPSLTGNWSDRTALAIDSLGRLHLAWTEPAAGGGRQVFYSRYEGGAWTPMEQLSHSTGYAGYPAIAVDALDRVHIVWYGFDGTYYQIYYRRLDGAGWSPERALTNQAADATNPSIALGPEGDVHVVWFRQTRNGVYLEIAYLHLVGDTVEETGPISTPGVDSTDPTIAVAPDGRVHVAWSARVGNVDRIEATERAANGTAWSAIEPVSPDTVGAQDPSLALDGLGALHVVWASVSGGVYAQVRNGTWSVPVLLSSPTGNVDPSVRWSQDHNPLCGANAALDVLWTHEDAGAYTLGYASIAAPVDCPAAPPSDAGFVLVTGVVAGVVAVVAAVLLWRWRRWYPGPPEGGE